MKKTVLAISIVIILFLSFSAVQAGENSTDNKTFNAIQQKIDNSHGFSSIDIDGTYSGNSKTIKINKSITIKGGSSAATLNAKEKSQIFDISADNVVLENLIFMKGTSKYVSSQEYGGAIYATGNNIKIINCTFISNYAQYGAGISTFGENVSVIDCKFSSNTAQYSGGAIEIDGNNNQIAGCVFNNNMAGHVGGAVAWVGDNGVLSNSTFDNSNIALSKSPQFGGAVVWMGVNGTLQTSTFTGFKSKKLGAAVYWKGEKGKLNYCIFNDNNSTNDLAYYGDPENAGYNYWGRNINSRSDFLENKLIYYNDSYSAPGNWVNIKQDQNSISFILNDGTNLRYYLPDYNYKNYVISKNQFIIKKPTSIKASNVETYSLYNGKTLKITLKSQTDALRNKKIQIKLNGVVYNKMTDKNGVYSLKIKLKNSQVYKAIISFAGDDSYASSFKTVKITVKKQKPKLTIKTKAMKLKSKNNIVKVVLKDQFKKAIFKKTVKLTIAKKTYKAKTNSKGVASFKIKLITKKTYSCKVIFEANKYYKSISKSCKIKIR